MSKYITDDYSNPDTLEGGFIPDELEDIDRLIREARKEVKAECKARHSDYKFNLPKIERKI